MDGIPIMTPAEFTAARTALGFSQRGVARALGVASSTITRWESGTSRIPAAIELALATLRRRKLMGTLRTQLATETITYFESDSPESWDWDEEIVEVVRTGERPRGSTNYLGANGTMITEYDASAEPSFGQNGYDATWEEWSGQAEKLKS